jgi:hypothetical protein
MKLHLSQLNPTVGDLDGNTQKILHEFQLASEARCDLAVFFENGDLRHKHFLAT